MDYFQPFKYQTGIQIPTISCFDFRVLAVGLKDFVAHGISQKTQIGKEGSINLARIPKISSVVGILGHLGGTHEREVCNSIRSMARESLADEDEVTNRVIVGL